MEGAPPKKRDNSTYITILVAILMVVTGSLNTLAARLADLVKFDSDSCVDKFDWPPHNHAAEVGAYPPDYKPTFKWPHNEMCPGDAPDDPPTTGGLVLGAAAKEVSVQWERFEPDTSKDAYDDDGKSMVLDFNIRMKPGNWFALSIAPCGAEDDKRPDPDVKPCNNDMDWTVQEGDDVLVAFVTKDGHCGTSDMTVRGKALVKDSDVSKKCKDDLSVPYAACSENADGTVSMTLQRYAETQDWGCDQRFPAHGNFGWGAGACENGTACSPKVASEISERTKRVFLLPEDAYGTVCGKSDYRCSFNHPFFQADLMFFGEFLCFLAYHVLHKLFPEGHDNNPGRPGPDFKFYLFALPACCDMCATGLMYVGLTLIYSSIFQMLRGSVIVFTMFFSFVFFRKRPSTFQYVASGLILGGLALVGVATFIGGSGGCGAADDMGKTMLGCLLILAGQVLQSLQVVIEEKFLGEHDVPPLLAVGLEGCFGMLFISCLIIPMHWIPTPFAQSGVRSWPTQYLEDVPSAFKQISCNPIVVLPLLGTSISIAFFNFAGVTITRRVSATIRMVLDSVRTVVIWVVSMVLHPAIDGMQGFNKLQFGWQAFGFVILLAGIAMYNRILKVSGLEPPFDGAIPDSNTLHRTRKEALIVLAVTMGMTQEEEEDILDVSRDDDTYRENLVQWIESHRAEVGDDGRAPLLGSGQSGVSHSSNRSSIIGLGKMQR